MQQDDVPARFLQMVQQLAQEHLDRERSSRPLPAQSPDRLLASLPLDIPQDGMDWEALESRLGQVMALTPSAGDPRFVNQLFGGRSQPAMAADMLAPVMNASMYTYKAAGPQILVEEEVIAKMAGLVGYAEGHGIFVPGGSAANQSAMQMARDRAAPKFRQTGESPARLVAYASDQAHYSVIKAAGTLGVGRENLRPIPSDSEGRMIPSLLEEAVREDLEAGRRPFCVVATAGTTVLGAFDPLPEIAAIARGHGLWLHVDGALGGSALLSRRHRHLLEASELSDSFTWNAHKLMGVPLTASTLLVRDKESLSCSFRMDADYLFQGDFDHNPGLLSPQCGRRNDAWAVWAHWCYFGDREMERRIDRLFEAAQEAARLVEGHPELELVREPASVTVCFRVQGIDSVELCRRLDEEGLLKVGYATVDGEAIVRLACVDPDMSPKQVELFFERVLQVAPQSV